MLSTLPDPDSKAVQWHDEINKHHRLHKADSWVMVHTSLRTLCALVRL